LLWKNICCPIYKLSRSSHPAFVTCISHTRAKFSLSNRPQLFREIRRTTRY
jgi:hypothetical protein